MEAAAAAAANDAVRDGLPPPPIVAEAAAVSVAGRQQLVWTVNVTAPGLVSLGSEITWPKRDEERSLAVGQELDTRLKALAQMDPLSPDWAVPRDQIVARAELRRLCLLVGQVKDKRLKAVLAAEDGRRVGGLQASLVALLHERSHSVQELAVAALTRLWALSGAGAVAGMGGTGAAGDAYGGASDPLLDLLDTHDAASRAVCSLVAAAAAKAPARVLPRLFSRLDGHARAGDGGDGSGGGGGLGAGAGAGGKGGAARRNALQVIEEILRLCPEVAGRGNVEAPGGVGPTDGLGGESSSGSSAYGAGGGTGGTGAVSVLGEELGRRLLQHLGDDELDIRSRSVPHTTLSPNRDHWPLPT